MFTLQENVLSVKACLLMCALFGMCVCVCVCEREREKETDVVLHSTDRVTINDKK